VQDSLCARDLLPPARLYRWVLHLSAASLASPHISWVRGTAFGFTALAAAHGYTAFLSAMPAAAAVRHCNLPACSSCAAHSFAFPFLATHFTFLVRVYLIPTLRALTGLLPHFSWVQTVQAPAITVASLPWDLCLACASCHAHCRLSLRCATSAFAAAMPLITLSMALALSLLCARGSRQ